MIFKDQVKGAILSFSKHSSGNDGYQQVRGDVKGLHSLEVVNTNPVHPIGQTKWQDPTPRQESLVEMQPRGQQEGRTGLRNN